MDTKARRILDEKEAVQAPRPKDSDPVAQLMVYYLDRFYRHSRFDQRFFYAVFSVLEPDFRLRLVAALYAGRPPEEVEAVSSPSAAPDYSRAAEAITCAWEAWEMRARMPLQENQFALDAATVEAETMKAFQACFGGRDLVDPMADRRERLAAIFGLSEAEVEILVFLWCSTYNDSFRQAVDALGLADYHRALGDVTGLEAKEVKALLAQGGRLVRMGFVTPDFLPPPHYALGEEMKNFFMNPECLYSFVVPLEKYLGEEAGRDLPLAGFPVPALGREIMESLLRAGTANILVHGAPGTGKTTFVTRLVRSLGQSAFILSAVAGSEDGRPPFIRLKVASHLARSAKAVLIIDEADSLINTDGRRADSAGLAKAWLTEFMDFHSGSIVWIANDIDEVHDAIKRRFAYSLEFRPQNERQRAMLWRDLVQGYGFGSAIGAEAIENLSRCHEVNAGGIDLALRGLRSVMAVEGQAARVQAEPVEVLSEILARHEGLMNKARSPGRARSARKDPRYLPEAINVDTALPELVAGLSEVARGIRARLDRESLGGQGAAAPRAKFHEEVLEAKLLFSGGPGTGKTAFARWLAEALDLPLIQKRASDLLSALVGGTEQLIAEAFGEAEDAGAILLLDEADSLFIDRRKAERSWERSQTNELLTRMEDYSGILVCCTNRREDFDPASMRRFQWKVAFSPPRPEQVAELYRRYFSELCGIPDEATLHAVEGLAGLCPGDFATVYKALVPLSAAPGAAAGIGHGRVIERLRGELEGRVEPIRRRIGFGD